MVYYDKKFKLNYHKVYDELNQLGLHIFLPAHARK